MSTTVDERVVKMEFDNSQFESNVKTSMSTLDKLKASLRFDNAAKGFEEIDKASSKVNLSGITDAVETASAKFSFLDVAAFTAFQRITNYAIDTGERLVKSLSIDQIASGWDKYTEKTANVQSIMNSTGMSMEQVNTQLNKLMRFSDETSFSFSEMTSALSTMLASGGDVEKLIPMIEGVAGATAYAGKSGSEFVHVMRNINQSYSSGFLNLMDWKSVELMGVNSKALIDSLIRAGEELGKIKQGEITLSNFRDSLSKKWADTSVMEKAFQDFGGLLTEAIDAVDRGDYKNVADAIDELSENYEQVAVSSAKAAQSAKSYTESIEATKDAVSSAWMNIMNTIFGDYDEAVSLWTDFTERLWDMFVPPLQSANDILDKALTSKWKKIKKEVTDAGISVGDFEEAVKKAAREHDIAIDDLIEQEGSLQKAFDKGYISSNVVRTALDNLTKSTANSGDVLQKYQKIVDDVWNGTYKTGSARIKALTDAGYDYYEIQKLVNKTQKNHKLTLEDLSDEQLKNIGYTDDEVEKLKKLREELLKTDSNLNDLINDLSKPAGRELLTDSLMTFLDALKHIGEQIGQAWSSIFDEDPSEKVYNFAENLNRSSHKLEAFLNPLSESGDKIQRTIKGVFAIFDIIRRTVGSTVIKGMTLLCRLLGIAVDDTLTMTAGLGDLLVKLSLWVKGWKINTSLLGNFGSFWVKQTHEIINSIREWIITMWNMGSVQKVLHGLESFLVGLTNGIWGYIMGAAHAVGDFVTYLLQLKSFDWSFQSITSVLKKFKDDVIGYFIPIKNLDLESYFKSVKEAIQGFIQRLKDMNGINLSNIWKVIIDFFDSVFGKIFNVNDSIKTVNKTLASFGNAIAEKFNLADGSAGKLWTTLKQFYEWGKEKLSFLKEINIGDIIAASVSAATIASLFNVAKILGKISESIESIISVRKGVSDILKTFRSVIASYSDNTKPKNFVRYSDGILNIAEAIALLAASIFLLSKTENIAQGVHVIAAITVCLTALALAAKKVNFGEIQKLGLLFVEFSGTVFILAEAIKVLSKLDAIKALASAGIVVLLVGTLAHIAKILSKNQVKLDIGVKSLLAFSGAIYILAISLKKISKINPDKIGGSLLAMVTMMFSLAESIKILSKTGFKGKDGLGVLAMVAAIWLLADAFKKISKLDMDAILSNVGALILVLTTLGGLIYASKWIKGTKEAGVAILAMAGSMVLIGIALNMISKMKPLKLLKSVIAISAIAIALGTAMKILGDAGANGLKASVTLLALGAALTLLTIPIVILSQIDGTKLLKATAIVAVLSILLGGLMALTYIVKPVSKSITSLAIVLGALVASLGVMYLLANDTDRLWNAVGAIAVLGAVLAAIEGLTYFVKPCYSIIVEVAALLAAVVVAFAVIDHWDIDVSIEKAGALSILLLALSAATLILSKIGDGAIAAIKGAAALDGVVLVLAALITALGLIFKSSEMQALLNGGLNALETLLTGLGRCIGGFVAGIGMAIADGFAYIGIKISEFWESSKEFFTGIKDLGDSGVKGAKAMTDILIALGVAELATAITNIIDWIFKKNTWKELGTNLVEFGKTLNTVCKDKEGLAGLEEKDLTVIDMASRILTAFSDLTNLTPTKGLSTLWEGKQSIDNFAKSIKNAANSVKDAIEKLKELPSDSVEITVRACLVLTHFTDLAGLTPKSGISTWWSGNKSISWFAKSVYSASIDIVKALNEFTEMPESSTSITMRAKYVLESFSDLAGLTPKSGISTWWSGNQSIDKFAKNVKDAAPNIVAAVNSFSGITVNDTDVDNAKKCAASLVDFASIECDAYSMIGLSELVNSLVGSETNAGLLPKFKTCLADMAIIATYNKDVDLASKCIGDLINDLKGIDKVNTTKMIDIANNIKSFGTGIRNFAGELLAVGFSNISLAITYANKLVDACNNINTVDTKKLSTFESTLTALAKKSIKGFTDTFKNAQYEIDSTISNMLDKALTKIDVNQFYAAGIKCINQFVDALGNNPKSDAATKVSNAGKNLGGAAVTALQNLKGTTNNSKTFYGAGYDCVVGFVNGINANLYRATKAGTTLGEYALNAAKRRIDSNSPSKEFYKLGNYSVQGYENAIYDGKKDLTKSGQSMADSAMGGLSDAIVKISDLIQNGIDAQPVIRPILDLTDVQNGVGLISSMFNTRQAVALATGINTTPNEASPVQVNINVYGAEGQPINELADQVAQRINTNLYRRNNTWR